MSEFKGTKGKLTIDKAEDVNGNVLYYGIYSNYSSIATCHPNEYCSTTIDMAKANAVLFSKAPEMLEMLNKIIEEYKVGNHDNFIMSDLIDESEKLIKEATE
ncbi:hypothetical protein [Elizabethkingia anophelis]|uniref:hypothetical protein n=1 Tax=Elizabethkingia anophelis TaxID=1117645 RepID=UPI0024072A6E|nr:hypothetical protein [Elizabethkingia anophelis]ELB0069511.1 hypothetical protein [Elizabethkingia anophelis]ELB1894338.1 hypothetical protein [Elizabethkingia anophelis]